MSVQSHNTDVILSFSFLCLELLPLCSDFFQFLCFGLQCQISHPLALMVILQHVDIFPVVPRVNVLH